MRESKKFELLHDDYGRSACRRLLNFLFQKQSNIDSFTIIAKENCKRVLKELMEKTKLTCLPSLTIRKLQ